LRRNGRAADFEFLRQFDLSQVVSGLEDLIENGLADHFNYEERCFFGFLGFVRVLAGEHWRICSGPVSHSLGWWHTGSKKVQCLRPRGLTTINDASWRDIRASRFSKQIQGLLCYNSLCISKRFRRTPGKEDLPKLAATERRIQFDDRSVNQKQNEDPTPPDVD
jgi:hypothetical protein